MQRIQWVLIGITVIATMLLISVSLYQSSLQEGEGDWGLGTAFVAITLIPAGSIIVGLVARQRRLLHAFLTFVFMISFLAFILYIMELRCSLGC